EDYAGAPLSPKYPGFHAWQAESGAYYFAAVSKRGQVQLRSEAYTTEEARDNGIESVMRNRDTEGRYKVVQEDGHWYLALRAGNNQEIARSCAFDSAAAATAAIATCFSTYQERAASRAIVEDYLPCEDYAGHKPAARYEGFTQFQHTDDGQHYFAMVDKDGKVVLRSEGYKSADARDNGIESVIRNRDIKEHWVKSQDADGHYLSLRAGNRQEIARTCPYESESALMGWWLPFASAAYVWGRPAGGSVTSLTGAAPTVAPVVEKTAPPPPPVVISTKKEAAPPPLTTYRDAEPAAAAGSGWWKWLLGALLLAGLLWLLMRGCNADQTAKVAAPVTTTAPAPPPANTGGAVVASYALRE
ncbi:MAG TPA: YegP family protein, partial [Saprospiraceae bacterium]|nr:YegP family protein [Saprospiraceae bacterium]